MNPPHNARRWPSVPSPSTRGGAPRTHARRTWNHVSPDHPFSFLLLPPRPIHARRSAGGRTTTSSSSTLSKHSPLTVDETCAGEFLLGWVHPESFFSEGMRCRMVGVARSYVGMAGHVRTCRGRQAHGTKERDGRCRRAAVEAQRASPRCRSRRPKHVQGDVGATRSFQSEANTDVHVVVAGVRRELVDRTFDRYQSSLVITLHKN